MTSEILCNIRVILKRCTGVDGKIGVMAATGWRKSDSVPRRKSLQVTREPAEVLKHLSVELRARSGPCLGSCGFDPRFAGVTALSSFERGPDDFFAPGTSPLALLCARWLIPPFEKGCLPASGTARRDLRGWPDRVARNWPPT